MTLSSKKLKNKQQAKYNDLVGAFERNKKNKTNVLTIEARVGNFSLFYNELFYRNSPHNVYSFCGD